MASKTSKKRFSFSKQAATFDRHINASIRGYAALRHDCKLLSQYFVQSGTKVVDVGCSTGAFLRSVRDHNDEAVKKVRYLGVDTNDKMATRWKEFRAPNVSFKKGDARKIDVLNDTSVVFSLFTLQFLPEADRLPLVKRIYNGLHAGGAFILAEKVHAKNAKIQNILTFMYYDFKRLNFSPEEILDKERSLRDLMHPLSEFKIFEMLRSAGFKPNDMQLFWRNHLFLGVLAMKSASYR